MAATIHAYWRSSPSWRVRIALAWKAIGFEVAPVNIVKDEHKAAAYLARNPQGRVPVLEIDGLSLTQAPAILEYLEETRPDPPLLPTGAEARARVRAMAALIATDVTPLQNLNVGRRLKAQFGADDDDVAEWSRSYIEAGLAELERQAGIYGGQFLYGDAFSLADVHLVPQLIAARRFGATVGPRLQAVEARCLQIPAVFDTRPEAQPDAQPG